MTLYLSAVLLLGALVFSFVSYKIIQSNVVHPIFFSIWIAFCLFIISIPLLSFLYKWLATLSGMESATNLIWVIVLAYILFYMAYITVFAVNMYNKIQVLISRLAIVESELHALRLEQGSSPAAPDARELTH